ncbi:MAG: vWA domain-containing protein, partial [Planctomycetota bacterium]
MRFDSPALLFSALALLPLAAIYLLKVRPTRRTTTTWFLWEGILQEKRQSALFKRLRDLLSLLLMALAFLACSLGLADPALTEKEEEKNLLILLDRSASMNTQEEGGSRFEQAKRVARDIIRALPSHRRAILATFDSEVRQVVNLTRNPRALLEGLDALAPGAGAARAKALEELLSNPGLAEGVRPLLISDGCFPGAGTLAGVELLKVGTPQPNLGITDFELVRLPGERNRLGLFYRTHSTLAEPTPVDLYLSQEREDNIVKVCPMTATPGRSRPETYIIEGGGSGRWILRTELKDALSLDNQAFAIVPPHRPIRVRIEAPENGRFFELCVDAFREEAVGMVQVSAGEEVVMLSGASADTAATGPSILFAPQNAPPLDAPAAVVIHRDHPAIRFCDLEGADFTGARRLTAPPGALVLIQTPEGIPLLYREARAEGRRYVVNLDPVRSGFFLSAYFPVMLYSMALDLTARTEAHPHPLRPGDLLPRERFPGLRSVAHTPLQGPASTPLPPPYRLPAPGFYRVESDSTTPHLAVSLLNANESNLDNGPVQDSRKPIRLGHP